MRSWNIVKYTVGISLLLFITIFLFFGFTEEANRINIRLSARISATFFAFAFMALALQHFVKGEFTFWLLANRKFVGVTFAIVHLIHLCLLGILHLNFHPIFEVAATSSIVGGGIAYFFLVLMLFTSFEQFSKYLSSMHWKLLHTVGGYWIWSIFTISYWKRMDTESEYIPMFLLFAIVLLLRISKIISRIIRL